MGRNPQLNQGNKMKRNFRKAFNALKKIGAPVTECNGGFIISEEKYYHRIWDDYWDILDECGLYPEWKNLGVVVVAEQ
jgi:hypothetical protein